MGILSWMDTIPYPFPGRVGERRELLLHEKLTQYGYATTRGLFRAEAMGDIPCHLPVIPERIECDVVECTVSN